MGPIFPILGGRTGEGNFVIFPHFSGISTPEALRALEGGKQPARRVRVKFAQNEGHEKATKKAQTLFFQGDEGHEKSHEKTTKKPRKSNEQKRHK